MKIPIVRGVTFLPYTLTFQDADEVPIDFTGCTAYAAAALRPGADAAITFAPVITDAPAGIITLPEMTPTQTLALPTGTFAFDLVIKDASGRRTQYLAGSTVTAAAGTLTGTALNSTITTASGLTTVAGGAFASGAFAVTPTRATLGLATTDSPTFAAITTTGSGTIGGSLSVAGGGRFGWSGASRMCSYGAIDGSIVMWNAAETSFNLLKFGGETTSFPALKRSTTTLQARLADDSGFAATQTLYDRFGSGTPEAAVTAPIGTVYHRTDGGAATSTYVKESGSGNTGWVAK